jgi:hypothetical protein
MANSVQKDLNFKMYLLKLRMHKTNYRKLPRRCKRIGTELILKLFRSSHFRSLPGIIYIGQTDTFTKKFLPMLILITRL